MQHYNQLLSDVLNVLGLTILNGKVYDTDKCQYLIFNGSYIIVPQSLIHHRKDVMLDILVNNKLVEYLMNVMIQKETEDNGLYMQVLSTEELPNPRVAFNKRRLIAKTNKGEFATAYYYNYCLCCIDLIFKIAQYPAINLHTFDYTDEYIEDKVKEQMGKRK